MAFTTKILDEGNKPWGYEVCVQAIENDNPSGLYICHFPKKPSTKFRDKEIARRLLQYIEHLSSVDIIEQTYSESEVTQILRKKGYFGDTESFSEDMAMKEIAHG